MTVDSSGSVLIFGVADNERYTDDSGVWYEPAFNIGVKVNSIEACSGHVDSVKFYRIRTSLPQKTGKLCLFSERNILPSQILCSTRNAAQRSNAAAISSPRAPTIALKLG